MVKEFKIEYKGRLTLVFELNKMRERRIWMRKNRV